MALDEYLYGKILGYFKKSKKQPADVLERTVYLTDIKEKLTILARAVSGHAIELFEAEKEGGYKNNSFFLPASFSRFNSKNINHTFFVFRVLYLSIQKKLNLNWQPNDERNIELSIQKATETAPGVLKELIREYPITEEWYQVFIGQLQLLRKEKQPLETNWLYGKWMLNNAETNTPRPLENISDNTKKSNIEKALTTIRAKAVEEVISLTIDKKQQEDYILTHNFEKVDAAEEFDGLWRDFDGEDDLKDHEEALNELNMKFTVRVDDTAHSVYQADFIENTTISESAEVDEKGYHLKYNEWDFSNNAYKENFCKVYPRTLLKTDSHYYNKTIKKNATTLIGLRKMLTNVNNKMQQHRRQPQGDEYDMDAITDLFVDLYSRHTPSEKIYIANRKKEKDLSILILLDVSLSSDGYADGNRIIDVEKEVSILFGEILNEFNVDFSIHSFYSKTRNFATYQTLKDFDASWSQTRHVIGAAEPDGYTRIGAALRHSGALLCKRQTKNKWVILLSDGKPNDFDKYEGKYGINDVKQALRELKENNINAYALTIEARAKYYLPQMFGQNHYQILTSPVTLLQSMVKLYEKIKNQS